MKLRLSILVALCACCLSGAKTESVPPYKNPTLTVAERTADLLGRMTLEEKVGQLLCPMGWEMYSGRGDRVAASDKFCTLNAGAPVGMLWAVYRADPWTQKTLANGLDPRAAALAGNALQRYMMDSTRLGIPLLLAEEAPHGHMAIGTTVFPVGLGMASTWSEPLMERVGEAIAREVRLQGAHMAFGPVMDLSRDARWSRTEESFGEDPVLTASLASAIVRGGGRGELPVISTLKHFAAYGAPDGGHNGSPSTVSLRELHESFLPPFREAIRAGAMSVMTSYNSLDGLPCTANPYLLNEVLRRQWGFNGFVISDLFSIKGIWRDHRVAATPREAAVTALHAGVDVDLGGEDYLPLVEAVREGEVPEELIDRAVERVLAVKFELGLFERPYVDPEQAGVGVRNARHVALAREVARQSIVLLKNNGILPLERNMKIALVGPNADNVYNQLGDYTAPQPRENVKTVLDGMRSRVREVEYVRGCAIRDTTENEIAAAAVAAALRADVTVAVVGGSSARDFRTEYIATGAAVASREAVSDMEAGEGYDRASLALLGRQQQLLEALKATGKPLVVIYVEGRPLEMNWAAENADALLAAWYPGGEGGAALADVLLGEYNPAGRLPISIPRSAGQIPVHYNRRAPAPHNYVEMAAAPLYAFGHGLSYATFEYSGLTIVPLGAQRFRIACRVRNSGHRAGDEVVQLYLRDEAASRVQPLMQLRGFERISLAAGQEREVVFEAGPRELSILGADLQPVVEPGVFTVMIGASSDDVRLKSEIKID
ncbi:MAG: glycoside hydrolase family 3 C-terminal domain-containing protein [Rikenellaceae bacterium]|nr:glycoside hydrolase family 3 C-terminal domain-containing protein [Rikenellaceae bacterium]